MVHNFYTGENPQNYNFKGHSGKIKCLLWDKDDLGFFTGGVDGLVMYWRLEDLTKKELILNMNGLNIEV